MLLLLKCPRTQLMAKFTIHATSVCLCVSVCSMWLANIFERVESNNDRTYTFIVANCGMAT